MSPITGNGVYRFGVFQASASARELRKQGIHIRIPGQSFEILLMLLEKPGEVVTRQEMRQRLWSSETFVDFEHGLNSAVKKLRAALSDSADGARYVETVPRVGYRFIAPVQQAPSNGNGQPNLSTEASVTPRTERATRPEKRSWKVRWIVAAAAVLLIVVGRILLAPDPMPRILSNKRLTTSSRIDAFGGLHSDGARLFFMQRYGHRWELMQMPVSGGDAQEFHQPFDNTILLAISPDLSEMIVAPFTTRADPLALYIMASTGGPVRRVGDVMASDATFTADGRQVTYATDDGIYVIGDDGLNPHRLAAIPGPKRRLDWSPDGRLLRFSLHGTDDQPSAIWEVGAAGGDARPLLPEWNPSSPQCCGHWTPDGHDYIFLVGIPGHQRIWTLPQKHGLLPLSAIRPKELDSGPVPVSETLLAKDGRHLFALGFNVQVEYVSYNLASHQYQSLLKGESADLLAFSATGGWTTSIRHDYALWRSKIDGTDAQVLAPASLNPFRSRLSPDGKEAAFEADPTRSGQRKVYIVSAEGGAPHPLVSETAPAERPDWSPDGSAIVYAAAKPDSRTGLFIMTLKNGETKKVPGSEGFSNVRWSPNGKFLAAISDDDTRLGLFEWATERWTEIAKGKVFGPPGWSNDSRYVFFQDVLETDEPVRRLRIRDGKLDLVDACSALLKGAVQRCGFEGVAPDGSLVLHLMRGDHDLYSLEISLPD